MFAFFKNVIFSNTPRDLWTRPQCVKSVDSPSRAGENIAACQTAFWLVYGNCFKSQDPAHVNFFFLNKHLNIPLSKKLPVFICTCRCTHCVQLFWMLMSINLLVYLFLLPKYWLLETVRSLFYVPVLWRMTLLLVHWTFCRTMKRHGKWSATHCYNCQDKISSWNE